MNRAFEDAVQSVGLSKRGALALVILSDASGAMSTADLVTGMQEWLVSSEPSAARDVSLAKSELFEDDLIIARHGIRNIELTAKGIQALDDLRLSVERYLIRLSEKQIDPALVDPALRSIRKGPGRAQTNKTPERKPAVSAGSRALNAHDRRTG